jgi:hypothetical protein
MTTTTQEPEKKPGILDPKANFRALMRVAVLLFVLLGGIWAFLRFTAGKKAADTVVATITRQPIELRNTIESVAANSFQGVALNLPYTGTLVVDLSVVKGNEVDVYVIAAGQLDALKAKKQFTHFQDFAAQKTKTYRRSARIAAGAYYLVLMDRTLGILSASASDIKTHARLEP